MPRKQTGHTTAPSQVARSSIKALAPWAVPHMRFDLKDQLWAKEGTGKRGIVPWRQVPKCPHDSAHPASLAAIFLVDRGFTGDGAIGALRANARDKPMLAERPTCGRPPWSLRRVTRRWPPPLPSSCASQDWELAIRRCRPRPRRQAVRAGPS